MSKRNENRPGYKKTKVGWIPEDWECLTIKEVCSQPVSGFSAKGNAEAVSPNDSNIGVLRLSCIIEGYFNSYENKKVVQADIPKVKTPISKDTMLISRSNTEELVGVVCYVEKDYPNLFLSDLIWQVSAKSSEILSIRWLTNLLLTKEYRRKIAARANGTSGSMKKITKGGFLTLPIPLPPLPEQKKIAEILSAWDRAIEQVGKLIDAKLRLKKGLMQQLLTGQMRFAEFNHETHERHEKDKGELPVGWREVRLGEVGKCVRGVSYKSISDLFEFETERTIRLLRANNINDSTINFDEVQYVIRNVVKREQILQAGDIVICMSSGSKNLVGKAAVYKETKNKYTVGAFCSIFRTKNQENKGFVQQLFFSNQYKRNLIILLSGTNINNLYSRDILKMKFFLPQKGSEQIRIAAVLSACDREIELLKKKQEKLRKQKRGLMQKLLTGEVRVKI